MKKADQILDLLFRRLGLCLADKRQNMSVSIDLVDEVAKMVLWRIESIKPIDLASLMIQQIRPDLLIGKARPGFLPEIRLVVNPVDKKPLMNERVDMNELMHDDGKILYRTPKSLTIRIIRQSLVVRGIGVIEPEEGRIVL